MIRGSPPVAGRGCPLFGAVTTVPPSVGGDEGGTTDVLGTDELGVVGGVVVGGVVTGGRQESLLIHGPETRPGLLSMIARMSIWPQRAFVMTS